jgi:Ciliary BBSome complex subunit 2, C-terminal
LCTYYYNNNINNTAALLQVNQMIQKASNQRMGSAKARVISESRAAIKANNDAALLQVLQQGYNPRASRH